MARRFQITALVFLSTCSLTAAQESEDPQSLAAWRTVQDTVRDQQRSLDKLSKEVKEMKKLKARQDDQEARLRRDSGRLDAGDEAGSKRDLRAQHLEQTLSTAREKAAVNLGALDALVRTRTLLLSGGLAAVAIGGVAMFIALRRRSDDLGLRLQMARTQLDEDTVRLDGKLIELLDQQVRAAGSAGAAAGVSVDPAKLDHSLAMRVGEEVYRVRQRLAVLPSDTKGLKPLQKSMERLEEEFVRHGYELVDLLNKPFTEEMNVKARFIPSDELTVGQRIITRVIKPPILYRGVILEVPEIEVSTGG